MSFYKEFLNSFIKGAGFKIPKRRILSGIGSFRRGRKKTRLSVKKSQAKTVYNLDDIYAAFLGRIIGNS